MHQVLQTNLDTMVNLFTSIHVFLFLVLLLRIYEWSREWKRKNTIDDGKFIQQYLIPLEIPQARDQVEAIRNMIFGNILLKYYGSATSFTSAKDLDPSKMSTEKLLSVSHIGSTGKSDLSGFILRELAEKRIKVQYFQETGEFIIVPKD